MEGHRETGGGAFDGHRRGRRSDQLTLFPSRSLSTPAVGEIDYESILERALAGLEQRLTLHKAEQVTAKRLYARLFELPPVGRRLLLLNLSLGRAWNLAHVLIERGHSLARADFRLAIEHAELATRVTARLSSAYYGPCLVAEIRARAWACLGNASRVAGRTGRADEAFHQARLYLDKGAGEPLEEALVFDLEASLHATRRRYPRAEGLLQRAVSLFQLVQDDHLAARARLKLAVVAVLQQQWQAARESLRHSVPLLDPERDAYSASIALLLSAAVRWRGQRWLTERVHALAELAAARRLMRRFESRLACGLLMRIEDELEGGRRRAASKPLLTMWPRWL